MQPALLIVDSDSSVVQTVMTALEGAQYDILWAGTGVHADSILAVRSVSVVLIDLRLARDEKFPRLSRDTGRLTAAGIPVIIMDASPEPETVKLARALGASGLLVKPFTPRKLRGVLSQAVAKSSVTAKTPKPATASTKRPTTRVTLRANIRKTARQTSSQTARQTARLGPKK